MSRTLRDRFVQALAQPHRERLEVDPTLDRGLARARDAVVERGEPLDDRILAEALARAVEGGVALDEIEVGDLYLAAGCARGRDSALRRFAADYGAELDRAIAKSPTLGLSAAEFRQLVFDRLFVSDGSRAPRIASYLGRGSLKAWVRVMTSRFVIDLSRRRDHDTTPDTDLAERIGAADDLEIDYLRHAYGPALDTAFDQAITALTVRQRNLLRQRYLQEISADTLARMYAVHRSTVFTWLEHARTALLDQVRRGLAERLPGDQLESVVGMLGSKLQISVRRMLDSRLESEDA